MMMMMMMMMMMCFCYSYTLPGVPDAGDYCLSFAYYLNGQGLGKIEARINKEDGFLKYKNDELLFQVNQSQGDQWHLASIQTNLDVYEQVRYVKIFTLNSNI